MRFSKYRAVANKYKILIPLLVSNYLIKNKTHEPAIKFVILSRSRTGSTMLINYLKELPCSYVQSEMLRRKLLIPFWKKIPDLIYGRHGKKYQIAGFKCFYYHPIDDYDSNKFIYKYILSNPEIKVIHWQREDLFAVIISRYIAIKTGKWAKTKKNTQMAPFYVNENEFRYDLETSLSQISMVKALFAKRENYFELTYEDVVKKNKLTDLFDFLGVDGSNIQHTSNSRQNSEDKYKFIINLKELRIIYEKKIKEIRYQHEEE